MSKWTIEYDNDVGPDDDFFEQWWTVLSDDGTTIYRAFDEESAERLCALLNATPASPDGLNPVAWMIDWPDDPDLGFYFSEEKNEFARSCPLYLGQPPSPVTFEQIAAVLRGIDQDEASHSDGWWETSAGAEFGKKKLAEIKALFGQVAARDEAVSVDELLALLPGPYYMDPPGGGSVTVLEQLQRMAQDAENYRDLRKSGYISADDVLMARAALAQRTDGEA